MKKKHSVARIV